MKSLLKLDRLLEERREEIPELRKSGQKVVGYVCCRTPVEIIYALGLIPIRVGVADEAKMATGKEFTHQFTCPYIKCIVGEMMEKGDFFHDNVDVLSGYVTCLTVHRCLEVLKGYTGKPTVYLAHPLNPPQEKERKFYEGEVNLFVKELEQIAEKELTPSRIEKSVELYNSIREKLRYLYKRQSCDGLVFKWSELLTVIHAGFILDPTTYRIFLEDLIKEVDTVGGSSNSDKKPRVMVIGSPILPGDDLLIKVIEALDIQIVADTLCTGLRTFEDLIIEKPTLNGIRDTYLNSSPCATAQDLDIEKDRRLNHILRLIQEYRVQGVIYYALRFCDHYTFKDDETKDFLKEKADIPMLAIHSEYGEAEEGKLRTRVEGFVETISWKEGV